MLETLKDIIFDFLLWFMIYDLWLQLFLSYWSSLKSTNVPQQCSPCPWRGKSWRTECIECIGCGAGRGRHAPAELVVAAKDLWRPACSGATWSQIHSYFCGHFGWSILKPFVIGRVYLSCGVLWHCSFWSVNHLPWHPEHKDNWVITSCTNEGWCRPKPHDFVSGQNLR